MGLFGTSPQKKLEKARSLQARQDYYQALRLYQELTAAGSRLSPGEISEAQQGLRACRLSMISLRLQEAEALRQAGDLEGARDRCQTAVELAGEDLPGDEIRETLARINAPHRPLARGARLQEAVETDLLPEPDETVHPKPTPVDRAPEAAPPKSDAELFGDDPAALFELYLAPLGAKTAEYFRSLGPDFRFGYLALSQGEGRRALDFLDRMDWGRITDPRSRLERANALLLADRAEEALQELDALAPAEPMGGSASAIDAPEVSDDGAAAPRVDEDRRQYLRVEAFRALDRLEDAVEAATKLADAQSEPYLAAESLLAWTLLEAGRAQEAYDRLRSLREAGYHSEELLIPAAQAAAALSRADDEMEILQQLIQHRLEQSVHHDTEVDFPVEAGRRLLALYQDAEQDPEDVRSLLLHLIDHDPERGDTYRELLLAADHPD